MKSRHVPKIDARYWTGITLASIFGTNLGDFYAHESGLGTFSGVLILVGIFFVIFFAERFDTLMHDTYYWLCIIIVRTGATNIADYLVYGRQMSAIRLSGGLAVLMALFAWAAIKPVKPRADRAKDVPDTNGYYWAAMLSAGIFGTILGDVCTHVFGGVVASIGLGMLLAVTLFFGRGGKSNMFAVYWFTIALARTAGTAIGDWLAENEIMALGLSLSTLLTGLAFAGVLLVWRSRSSAQAPP